MPQFNHSGNCYGQIKAKAPKIPLLNFDSIKFSLRLNFVQMFFLLTSIK